MRTPEPQSDGEKLAATIDACFISPNESDRNGEIANVVDGLFAIARALESISWQYRCDLLDRGVDLNGDRRR